jgi:hypothetical protein
MKSKTLIIGGGAAGFFAAIVRAAKYPEEEITILERGYTFLLRVPPLLFLAGEENVRR